MRTILHKEAIKEILKKAYDQNLPWPKTINKKGVNCTFCGLWKKPTKRSKSPCSCWLATGDRWLNIFMCSHCHDSVASGDSLGGIWCQKDHYIIHNKSACQCTASRYQRAKSAKKTN